MNQKLLRYADLVDRNGQVIAKFGPRTAPSNEKLVAAIEGALEQSKPEKKEA